MDLQHAYALIKSALEKVSTGMSARVTEDTHLIKDGLLDSLDSMNFLFELETMHGSRLKEIDDTFEDFRIVRLAEILMNA